MLVSQELLNFFKRTNPLWKEKISKKTEAAYLATQCLWPAIFYFSYIYCGSILKYEFGYNPAQIIRQSFFVAVSSVLSSLVIALLSNRVSPLKILKVELSLFTIVILSFPLILMFVHTPNALLAIQCLAIALVPTAASANAIFYIHFPVFERFARVTSIRGFSRILMPIVTSFGLVYATDLFGYSGVFLLIIPLILCYAWGIHHFKTLEKSRQAEDDDLSIDLRVA